jgi:hypothetical protein
MLVPLVAVALVALPDTAPVRRAERLVLGVQEAF